MTTQTPKPAIAWSTFHIEAPNTIPIATSRSSDGGVYLRQGQDNIYVPANALAAFKRAVKSLEEIVVS
jgi:hypothetical protein